MVSLISADWCKACDALKSILIQEHIENLFMIIDIEKDPLQIGDLIISALPTLIFQDGFVYIGAPPLKLLHKLIEEHEIITKESNESIYNLNI